MPGAVESTIRTRAQTIIRAVSGITSARVVLGNDDITQSKEWLDDIAGDGVYTLILPAEQGGFDRATRTSEVDVRCKVWFGFSAHTNYTFTATETTIFAMRDALVLQSNWTDCAAPDSVTVRLLDVDRTLNPCVGVYEITMTFSV